MTVFRLLFISVVIFTSTATTNPLNQCQVLFNGVQYKIENIPKEEIKSIYTPQNLAVEHTLNNLFFTYCDIEENKNKSMKINLDTGDYSIIPELRTRCAFTVDQERHEVYAGCSDGLYHYDPNEDKFVLVYKEQDIKSVYYHGALYYTMGDPELLYKFSEQKSVRVDDLGVQDVYQFVINNDNDKIYNSNNGVYLQKSGSSAHIYLNETEGVRGLAVDASGETYLCDYEKDSIAVIDKKEATFNKIVDAPWCHGLTFDKDYNLLYANWITDKIVRLIKC